MSGAAAMTSAPARTASRIVGAPSGQTMNSWKSSGLGACAPPLRTLKQGTGSLRVEATGGEPLEERHPVGGGERPRHVHRHAEDGVRAQPRLVRRPVERAHGRVDLGEIGPRPPGEQVIQLPVDVGGGPEDAAPADGPLRFTLATTLRDVHDSADGQFSAGGVFDTTRLDWSHSR